jgi:hypothetical protein
MPIRFIGIAAVHFVTGVGSGICMRGSDPFSFPSAHAHIHLPGWVSLALAGLSDHAFLQAGQRGSATAHNRLNRLGASLLILAMTLFGLGKISPAVAVSAVGGLLVMVGVENIMKNLRPNG